MDETCEERGKTNDLWQQAVASMLSEGRKIHISPWFRKAAKEESKLHSVFPVSGMHRLITHFYKFWGSFFRGNISFKICFDAL